MLYVRDKYCTMINHILADGRIPLVAQWADHLGSDFINDEGSELMCALIIFT